MRDAAFLRVVWLRQQPGPLRAESAMAVVSEKSSARAAVNIVLVIYYSYDSKYEGTKLHNFF
jgi:hypothetical protein